MIKKLNAALLILGMTLLAYLVWRVGPEGLWHQVKALGWGILPLTLSEGAANLAHTLGWRHCINSPHGSVPFQRLFRMSMAGFAINYLTPSASIGGEVSKAALLAMESNGAEAVGSVLADKLCLGFAHLLLAVMGSLFLLWHVALSVQLWLTMVGISVLMAGGMITFLLMQKHGKLEVFLRWLVRHKLGGMPVQKAAQRISEVDEALKVFYRERPANLCLSVGWHFIGHSVAFLQVWLFLCLLNQPVPLVGVLTAGFLGLWIDLLTFAIPFNLGALEGSRLIALKAIGCGSVLGMAFGVAIRITQVTWAAFGLLNYGFLCRLQKGRPRVIAGNPMRTRK